MSRISKYCLGTGFACLVVVGLINTDNWKFVITVSLSAIAGVAIVIGLCVLEDYRP